MVSGSLPHRARRSPPRSRRPRRRRTTGLFAWVFGAAAAALLLVGLAAVGTGVAVAYGAYVELSRDLPPVEALAEREVFTSTRILDREGRLLYELFSQNAGKRNLVHLKDLPRHLIEATIATEDADFYSNPGFDVRGIARAAVLYVRYGEIMGGGSTITQQLIKNTLLEPEERQELTLSRKLREAILAYRISQRYSKDEILELYLNEIYYGNLSYGVEAAAQTYFGKPAHDLTLAEAALLAGLPQAPAAYDPFKEPQRARARQATVLDLMVKHGYITPAQAEAAKLERLSYASPPTLRAPHFVQYVQELLWQRYHEDLFRLGLTVTTTLDLGLQEIAEQAIREHAEDLAKQKARNAALVAIDPRTGELLAMVGSPDFADEQNAGQVNAALALRQPGSAIKPIVYLTAFEKGFGPGTVVIDRQTRFPQGPGQPDWVPQNFDNRFRGPVTLRRALGNSLNIPAVKVLQFAGLPDTIETGRRLGIQSLKSASSYGLSFALGGGEVRLLELAGAYAVFANGGERHPVTPFLRIEDAEGTVLEALDPKGELVADPRAVWLLNDILSDDEARRETFGPNSPLKLSRPAAVKTGSTDDYRDSWTIGYTPNLVAGVWVGNADGTPTVRVLGSSGAGRIWHTFMERALAGRPVLSFERPGGLVRARVCASNGFLATSGCTSTVEDWFVEGRLPDPESYSRRRYAIDSVSGKLATAYCPLDTIVFKSFARTTSGDGEAPPTEYCDVHRTPVKPPWELPPTPTPAPIGQPTAVALPGVRVEITSPAAGERVRGEVRVVGSAVVPGFQFYKVEWGEGSAPTRWHAVSTTYTREVVNGLLDTWNTAGLPDGTYTLLVTSVDRTGNYKQAQVTVTVANRGG